MLKVVFKYPYLSTIKTYKNLESLNLSFIDEADYAHVFSAFSRDDVDVIIVCNYLSGYELEPSD